MTTTNNYFLIYSNLLTQFELSKQAFKLACCLFKSANYKTGKSYKSKRTMAEECGCSVSTISRGLRELKIKKVILVEPFFGSHSKGTNSAQGNRQTTNVYYVDLKLSSSAGQTSKTVECAKCSLAELSPNELKVYAFISMRVGSREKFSISRQEISRACRISKSLVTVIVRTLLNKGFIDVACSDKKTQKGFNVFSVIRDKITEQKTSREAMAEALEIADAVTSTSVATKLVEAYTTLAFANTIDNNSRLLLYKLSVILMFMKLYSEEKAQGRKHGVWFWQKRLKISATYLLDILNAIIVNDVKS